MWAEFSSSYMHCDLGFCFVFYIRVRDVAVILSGLWLHPVGKGVDTLDVGNIDSTIACAAVADHPLSDCLKVGIGAITGVFSGLVMLPSERGHTEASTLAHLDRTCHLGLERPSSIHVCTEISAHAQNQYVAIDDEGTSSNKRDRM